MLPSGDGTSKTPARKGGMKFIRVEDLTTSPQEYRIMGVKYNEQGRFGPQVQIKLAFNGEPAFLSVPPNKKDARYKALTGAFGFDENEWVDKYVNVYATLDKWSEQQIVTISIPDQKKKRP